MQTIDLSKIIAGNNEVELTIPGIGGTGFFVTLRHDSSPEVQSFIKKYQNRVLEDTRKGGKNKTANAEFFKLERPLAHIANWRWTNPQFNFGGDQPEFSRDKAIEMLKGEGAFSFYLRQLIDEELADDESFLAKLA